MNWESEQYLISDTLWGTRLRYWSSGYGTWLHGGGGLNWDRDGVFFISQMELIELDVLERIRRTLIDLGLPITASNLSDSDVDRLVDTIRLDKKVKDGLLTFILILEIGKVKIERVSEKVSEVLVSDFVELVRSLRQF